MLAGGGELGARLRATEWDATALGPTSTWPQSLRSALSICLGSRFPIAIYWGPELALVYNDAWSPILGEKHPWALGRPAREVWPEIWDTIGPMFQQVMSLGEATYSEDSLLLMHRHGYTEECFFNFTFSPIRGEGGRVEGVFNAVIETTYRVLAERRTRVLRDLGEKVALAVSTEDVARVAVESLGKDSADVPFCVFYRVERGGDQARLAACAGVEAGSDAAPLVVGLGREDERSWPLARARRSQRVEVVRDRNTFASPASDAAAPSTAAAFVAPITLPFAETPTAFLVLGANPRRAVDGPYVEFVEKAASQLAASLASAQRRDELAELDRAKTAFFSNVSHEFRTPLTLMLGPLEDALASPDHALVGESLETAHRNALRLLKLVNTLLDFSRIEAGRVQAAYEKTDLASFTAELASVFRSAVERAGLRYRVETSTTDAVAYVDRDMWEKIVLNLLSNALKFTFEGEIAIAIGAREGDVTLTVRDTGTGVAPDEVPHLFERFHRVRGAKARTHEGSGIGLALVHELVKLHGGEVRVESAEGKGTQFEVRIPRGSDHLPSERVQKERPLSRGLGGAAPYVEEALRWLPSTPAASQNDTTDDLLENKPPQNGPTSERIVLADDNADMRAYLTKLLAQHWRVEAVGDGLAALDAIRRERPALVVSDVMMPGLDGFGLLRRLREDTATSTIPVVLLSARAGEEATAEALDAGANDYLIKPFSGRDVVARIAAQINTWKTRHAERRRLLTLLEQVPAIVNFLRGPELIFDFAHPMAVAALGGRELLGKPILEAIPEHRGQPYYERMQQVFATGEPFRQTEAEARLMIGGKEVTSYWDSVYLPVRDESGRVEGVMTFDLDVTEAVVARRELEHAARTKDELLTTIATTRARADYATRLSGVGFWYCDLPFDELRWDARVKEHFFLPADARVTIDTFYERIVPEDREPTRLAIEASINDHTTYDVVYRTHDPASGAVKWVRAMGGTSYGSDGAPTHFDGVTVDISAHKRNEEALKNLAERERAALLAAEEASRAKDDFLAMLGHELRNPLAPIATAVHLLKLRSEDTVAREVGVIERQTQHITRLVDDLLDVARVARGKVVLAKDSVEVADLVAAAIEIASPAIESGRHALVVNVPKHGLVVDADRGRMKQVLANLLTNAAKYTPVGGRICVTAARDGTDVVVSVEDSGVGISAELLPQVFDLFVQARQTMDRAQGGLGLGLALVKNLVLMHGGTVSVQSAGLGRGSTFMVRLPCVETSARKEEEPSSQTVATAEARQRVLIVDDNVDGADMLSEALETLGYVTAVAHDGPEALRVARDFAPEVALLDIGLPVMNGYELAQRLRAEWADVKLAAITGYGQESDRERAREAGFVAHLTKPVDFGQLASLLATFASEPT